MKVKGECEKTGLKLNIQKTKIMTSSLPLLGEKVEKVADFIFLGSKIIADVCHKSNTLAPWMKCYDKPGQHIKKQRNHFADSGPYSQSYGFSSSHVWMLSVGP